MHTIIALSYTEVKTSYVAVLVETVVVVAANKAHLAYKAHKYSLYR